MHGKSCYRGRSCSVEDNEMQPQHTCTLFPASQGSGAAKAPMQRLTSRSVFKAWHWACGVMSQTFGFAVSQSVDLRLPSKNKNEKWLLPSILFCY